MTEEEKAEAHMPPTNDANKGILGELREDKRDTPNSTTHAFNARTMFRRNNTQAYMDANFGDEHHLFIMLEHRKFDASGVVKKKKAAHRAHVEKVVNERREKRRVRNAKRKKVLNDVAKVIVETNEETLRGFTKAQLKEQLAAHRLLDGIPKLIPAKSNMKTNAVRLQHLLLAVERYEEASESEAE
ncbi:hypothetical protein B0H16DRAFT_1742262 [Mycena metata]|uniref:Uncharacterized protein n=1 Tax=Mycena metata TaxID=1033252 RepID=A0AAD7MFJ1_9AGAR|nr:hypothetical protein B0H16DRAFT_1742262 [Mycena metata]